MIRVVDEWGLMNLEKINNDNRLITGSYWFKRPCISELLGAKAQPELFINCMILYSSSLMNFMNQNNFQLFPWRWYFVKRHLDFWSSEDTKLCHRRADSVQRAQVTKKDANYWRENNSNFGAEKNTSVRWDLILVPMQLYIFPYCWVLFNTLIISSTRPENPYFRRRTPHKHYSLSLFLKQFQFSIILSIWM